LSGLLPKHILAGSPFENLTQPQHCVNILPFFSALISEHSRRAASLGMGSSGFLSFIHSTEGARCNRSHYNLSQDISPTMKYGTASPMAMGVLVESFVQVMRWHYPLR
jgi:hypothetical protein